ncbi:transmembrane protein [Ceratobasidium sp. AG-Ba]|nr:transmembrane protein [Ceratobasidium sp. AG-Ba]
MAGPHVRPSTPSAGLGKRRPLPIYVPARDGQTPGLLSACFRTPMSEQVVEHSVHSQEPKSQPSTAWSLVSVPLSTLNPDFLVKGHSSTTRVEQLKDPFLNSSAWRTDISTFCSHAKAGSILGEARITHVQARKSRRPPFLHEYLLVFFTTANGQRFVARIDRLGKIASAPGSSFFSWSKKGNSSKGALDTAVQQVEVYQIPDSQTGIDSSDGPWYAYDGSWGSYPIATLVSWLDVSLKTTDPFHYPQANTGQKYPVARLSDVSRLLEAILFEMPA